MAVKYVDIEYLRAQNANAGQLILAGSSNTLTYTQYVTVDINGNVGIGTAAPTSTLSVQGNVQINGQGAVLIFSDGTSQATAAYNNSSSGDPGAVQFAGDSGSFEGNRAEFYWDSGNVRLGVGTSVPLSTLQVKDTAYESNRVGPWNNTNIVVLDSFPATRVRSAHYFVQVTDETNSQYHTSQVMVVQDGAMAYKSEYNIVTSHDRLGTFDARVQGGNLELTFTAFVATTKTAKIARTSMTA
jgi:hypothetical protein